MGSTLTSWTRNSIIFLGRPVSKTTTLQTSAALIQPASGDVFFVKGINDPLPYKREVNTVFQRYALFPHPMPMKMSNLA